MWNRIYVTGSVGSGKSTFARNLAEKCGYEHIELDSVVYKRDPDSPSGSIKRSDEERNTLFAECLEKKRWIMEDTGRKRFKQGMEQADRIILLDPPVWVVRRRIIVRWIKQNLHIEKCGYKPGFGMLKATLRWARDYKTGLDGLKLRLEQYSDKLTVLRNNREIKEYISSIK